MLASGGFWQLLAAAEAWGHERSGNLSMGRPRTVWKEQRNNLMLFQMAYIKAKCFRVGYNLFYLVRLLVSVNLKIDYRCAVSRLR